MGDFKMGNNTVLTQSGTAKPTFGSGVPTGTILKVSSVTNNNEWQATTGSIDTEYPIFGSSTTNAHTSTTFKVETSPASSSSNFFIPSAILPTPSVIALTRSANEYTNKYVDTYITPK